MPRRSGGETASNFHLPHDMSTHMKTEFLFFSCKCLLPKQVCGRSHPKPDLSSSLSVITKRNRFLTISPRDHSQASTTQCFSGVAATPSDTSSEIEPRLEQPCVWLQEPFLYHEATLGLASPSGLCFIFLRL